MALPIINSPKPSVIPAIAEQTFPNSYIIEVKLTTGSPNPKATPPILDPDNQQLSIVLRNYNAENHKLDKNPNASTTLNLDVWQEVSRSTLFAGLIEQLFNVSSLYIQEQQLIAKILELQRPYQNLQMPDVIKEQIIKFQAELAEIDAKLGISE